MTDAELAAWGKQEHEARLADIAAAKAGTMTLEQAQKNARSRARKAGLRGKAILSMQIARRAGLIS